MASKFKYESFRKSINDESFEILDCHGDILSVRYCNSKSDNKLDGTGEISPLSKRTQPLKLDEFQKFLDTDGRLVDESLFRKAVFLGGVEPIARRDVWQFLFSLYPYSSTKREREVMLLDYIVKYNEMKNRWKTLLVLSANPCADKFEQGILARYQLDEQHCELKSPDFDAESPVAGFVNDDINIKANQTYTLEPDFTALSKNCQFLDVNSADTQQRIEFMKIQAKVYVQRHKIKITEMKSYLRIVDKDVPRTDRDVPYFMDPNIHHLTMLRDILITYATFHPDIGYVQGMNDILARFLYIFDSEVEAYWCFQNYLEKIESEFLEEGMLKKIDLVKKLLLEMDEELYQHLVDHDLGDLLFCHRWLLLGFKREFSFMDSLRVFEILSSHHLELSSVSAETARHKLQMKEFADNAGFTRSTPVDANSEYTLELFMCVALLQETRMSLFQCSDACMVFDCINNLEINLDSILEKCEHLFFRYCKKTVEDSFQMVEKPPNKHR